MFNILLILGAILLIVILLVVFRVHTLVNVMRGSDKGKIGTSNKVNAFLFLVFLLGGFGLFFWYSYTHFDYYTLPVASEHGVLTDNLFWVTTAICGFVFIVTNFLLFYFPFRYQYKEGNKATFYPDNSKLELIWTIVPAIVLSILIFYGWKVWSDITDVAPEEAEVVEIMGYQFAWKTRYPGKDKSLGNYDFRLIDAENLFGMDFRDKASFDDFSPREVHLPKGKPVLFKIRARDVLHSVFAPHFRLKMDAVPGMPTRFWFVPTKSTQDMRDELGNPEFNYEIACTEICGRGHFSMRLVVVVDEPEEYDKWYNEQEPWLSKNPHYLAKVPNNLKELALLKAGLDKMPR
ncbi:MAG: cytochrome c oxidase subunit II [Bacteroidetes bacterium]|nr:cytochrome c oxidase subunit II [Bacteroidota bacterium]